MTTETGIYEYAKQGLSLSEDKIAIWFYGKSITYRELFEKIDNVADHLYALGVREGTVVTIHLPNCPQAVMAIYAVAKLGGICNMVHALIPKEALYHNLSVTNSNYLITHLSIHPFQNTIIVDPAAHMSDAARDSLSGNTAENLSELSFEKMELRCNSRAAVPLQRSLNDKCAFYLHSGGTTGTPKTIMLSHSAINHCVDNTADFFEKQDMKDQVSLCVLPLFHGFGLVMDVHRNVAFGSTQVQMLRWDVNLAVRLIKMLKVTLIVGVPAMYYALLNDNGFCGEGIRQLSMCFVGGDNVSTELVREFDERVGGGHHLFVGFGLTEATTTDCVNCYRHYKEGSCGYPVRDTVIAVMDNSGVLHDHGVGEFVISSNTLMMGYLNDPEATKNVLFYSDDRLWTRTGDEVEIDDDGFVFFRDRIKNIIIHNGYNIYPADVESVICQVDGVQDACLIGIENQTTHTQDVAVAVLTNADNHAGIDEDSIRLCCQERLPRYAIPRYYLFLDEFPLTALGKIDRKKLRSMF